MTTPIAESAGAGGQYSLPAVADQGSTAVGSPRAVAANEVAPAVRSFRHLLFALLGLCALAGYFSLRQIDYNRAGHALYDVDRVVTALRINAGVIAAAPPASYRDLSNFSAVGIAAQTPQGLATGTSLKDVPDQTRNRVDPAAPVPGTHLLGPFAIRFAAQMSCFVAAFSGDPRKAFRIAWQGVGSAGSNRADVSGEAISLIKFERGCRDESMAPSLLVIAIGPTYVLGIPRSYNLVLSPSVAGLATDFPDLARARPLPFDPGPGLLSNYGQAARRYIADPEKYDLYDFETAKAYLAAWAARVTGKWYSPLDYQIAANDLLSSGAAQERMFVGDHRYAWFMRAAFLGILALTLAMWRRIRLVSLIGVPRPLPWLLADVGDRVGLFIAWIYVLAVPLAVLAVCALYAEASFGLVGMLRHAFTEGAYGSLIARLEDRVLFSLSSPWGLGAGVVLLLELLVLVACMSGMIGVLVQARRLRLRPRTEDTARTT